MFIMHLMTREDAARRLRVGLRTLDRRIASGDIECYRLGDGPRAPVRISEDQIVAFLERGASAPRREARMQATKIIADR